MCRRSSTPPGPTGSRRTAGASAAGPSRPPRRQRGGDRGAGAPGAGGAPRGSGTPARRSPIPGSVRPGPRSPRAGSRKPWSRMTGQNVPYWNQRMNSSRYASSAGRPPWKPPMSVVHHGIPASDALRPAGNLPPERLPRRHDVAAPQDDAVPLGSRPRRAGERDHVVAAHRPHPLRDEPCLLPRERVLDREARPGSVGDRLGLRGDRLGLAAVEPDRGDAPVEVAAPHPVEHEPADVLAGVVDERQANPLVLVRLDERRPGRCPVGEPREAVDRRERLVVRRGRVHERPRAHHHPHAEARQLRRHRLHVRPVPLVERPVAVARPVERVDHEHGERQAARHDVLPHDVEHLRPGRGTAASTARSRGPSPASVTGARSRPRTPAGSLRACRRR